MVSARIASWSGVPQDGQSQICHGSVGEEMVLSEHLHVNSSKSTTPASRNTTQIWNIARTFTISIHMQLACMLLLTSTYKGGEIQ